VTPIRAIVFDFDGVLADTEPLHLAACQEIFSTVGVELSAEEYYEQYVGFDDEGMFRRMGEIRGWQLSDEQIAALIRQKSEVFDQVIARTDVLYPAARECVELLAASYPLGIASGALKHEIESILERGGLRRFIRFIVASGDTQHSKPSPDPYLKAAALHGLTPAECVAIEDSRWGIEAAKAAGMTCVAITNTYDASQLAAADRVIRSIQEFTPAFINGLQFGT
jgi:beta-phosphoglucomutase